MSLLRGSWSSALPRHLTSHSRQSPLLVSALRGQRLTELGDDVSCDAFECVELGGVGGVVEPELAETSATEVCDQIDEEVLIVVVAESTSGEKLMVFHPSARRAVWCIILGPSAAATSGILGDWSEDGFITA